MSFETRDERQHFRAAPPAREVTLRYPLPWFSASDEAPGRARSITPPAPTLRVCGPRGWRGPGIARFGGFPALACDPQRAATATRFLMFWLLLGEDAAEADALAAIRGDDVLGPHVSPGLRAWWETARRYRTTMGRAWCERLGEHFADWRAALRCEARWLALRIEPAREELLPVRVAAVGAGPTLDLVEYVCDCPLPLVVRDHPAHGGVLRHAARLLAIQDELVHVADDRLAGRPNLFGSHTPVDEIEAFHDETLCGLTGAAQWLRAEFPRCPSLARWLAAVQAICHAFARRHTNHDAPPRSGSPLAIEIEYV